MDTMSSNMNPTVRICPACQQPLPADAPQGLCPQCLAKSALGSQPGAEETLASGSKPGGTGPATIQMEISRLFPQLEIMEPLGQGGMGMVYKARQPQLDRIVALKVMRADLSRDPAFAERFAREARALAKLNHPNIVSVFDFGQSGGHCWILMEFVDGTNLRELLRTKTLQPREALGIVPKVCDALQYAHDEGIVHRDIKPENILLDKKGRVKIADFGLAKLVGKDASEFSLTATGMTLGTPRYMAPEQFDKPQEVDHRADIYSLGVVLYEMLTGEVPMGRFSLPSATIGVDVRLDEIVLRTLEKEPSRRYQHVSEVKTQVETVTGQPKPASKIEPEEEDDDGTISMSEVGFYLLVGALTSTMASYAAGVVLKWDNKRWLEGHEGAVWLVMFAAILGGMFWNRRRIMANRRNVVAERSKAGGENVAGTVRSKAPPSAEVQPVGSGEVKAVTLLDESMSGWKRWFPIFPALAGIACLLIGFSIARTGDSTLWMVAACILGLWSFALSLTHKVGWTVEYRGHRIRFEYILLKYKRLMIDGRTVASGGMGWFYELRTTIKEGQGVGDEIICTVEADMTFRCRIIALPRTSATDVEKVAGLPQVPSATEATEATEPASSAKLLLDETDRSARQFQHLFFIGGLIWILLGLVVALIFSGKLPIAAAMWAGGIAMLVMASRHRQQWEVDYLGHVIRFENGIYTSGRLMIDGNVVASGGVGFHAEISGRIPRGSGAGQRIVAKTNAEFRFFRCQLFAETNAMAPAKEAAPVALDHRVSEALAVGLPGWFNRRAPWMQKLIQAALTVAVAFATLVFLGFNIHSKTDVTAGQVSNSGTVQVGQPSPWLTVDFSSTSHSFAIHWFSASLWIGLAGLALGFLSERLRRSVPGFDEERDRRKRQMWLVVMIVVGVLYVAGLVVNGLIMSGATSSAARGVMDRALGTKTVVSPNPYTFAGLPAPFVKGADGPELGAQFVKQMGFTPLQVTELNKTFQGYYRDFLSLERRHTELSRNAQGHVVVKITAFPEESLALAQRMAQELRGLVGKEVIPTPQPGMLSHIGLFRHAGEATVTAELWKQGGLYYFKEERVGAPNVGHVNEGSKSGRSTSGEKLSEVIPEEYRVYWKE